MKNISSWLKWTWYGGHSPVLCHPMRTEMAPPVASLERSTFMSRSKGFIVSASSGLTMRGCNSEVLVCLLAPVCGLANGRRDRCVMTAPPFSDSTISDGNDRAELLDLSGHL